MMRQGLPDGQLRAQRRHGMRIVNPVLFYPWRVFDFIRNAAQWVLHDWPNKCLADFRGDERAGALRHEPGLLVVRRTVPPLGLEKAHHLVVRTRLREQEALALMAAFGAQE